MRTVITPIHKPKTCKRKWGNLSIRRRSTISLTAIYAQGSTALPGPPTPGQIEGVATVQPPRPAPSVLPIGERPVLDSASFSAWDGLGG